MQELIEFIMHNMLPEGTEYSVDCKEDEQGVVFTLNVPVELKGKLIGKSGRNIKAIRDIMSVVAKREDKRVYLKVVD